MSYHRISLGVTKEQQKILLDIPPAELKNMSPEERLNLVLRRQEVKASESASLWNAISTAAMVAAPIAALIGLDQLSKKGK